MTMKNFTLIILALLFLSACSVELASAPEPTTTFTPTAIPPTDTHTPIPPTETFTPTITLTPTQTYTPTFTFTPTNTEPPTPTPTYSILRGYVIPEKLSCRFGPGVMYLYKYGLFEGTVMEVIGRLEDASWVLIQASKGKNPCWVNAEMMDIKGDVMSVAPVDIHIVMPWSPYYGPLTNVSATRVGNEVTVFWDPLILRAGDDSEQVPYVLEAWVCQGGKIVFNPVGSYTTAAKVIDEPGCEGESYGRVLAAEKHGYTQWVVVPWPAH